MLSSPLVPPGLGAQSFLNERGPPASTWYRIIAGLVLSPPVTEPLLCGGHCAGARPQRPGLRVTSTAPTSGQRTGDRGRTHRVGCARPRPTMLCARLRSPVPVSPGLANRAPHAGGSALGAYPVAPAHVVFPASAARHRSLVG